mmetsp:Transcript_14873/g.46145  ORF Transcript_14873/g.46145 Transcript_14873/m.46145 type:complete len:178 (+) Transcript_14873:972-1505(+)
MKEPRSSPRATRGRVDAAQLCLERGADINQALKWPRGMTPQKIARDRGHMAMTAWLALIRDLGWARYDVAATRYKLVVLRAAAARGRARRQHAFYGKELVLDFLFPNDQPPPQANLLAKGKELVKNLLLPGAQPKRQAARYQPRLPDDLFAIIVHYYSGLPTEETEEAEPEDSAGDY